MNTVKKHATHAIKQVELLNFLLNNLQQFNLKPTTKLVLLYLAGCYNPKHSDVFPKQKTIALQMGISERSVISAIQELHKEGLVISERKYTNRYRFTSRILNLGAMVEDFSEPEEVADEISKNFISETEKFAPTCIEQEKEQKKEQTIKSNSIEIEGIKNKGGNVYSFKSSEDCILEEYAIKHGARNVKAYVNTLKSSGSAAKIISEYKKQEKVTQIALRSKEDSQKTLEQYSLYKIDRVDSDASDAWQALGIKFGFKKAIC